MTTDYPADWVSTSFRVRYAETDQMGVVYYANYLVWFEIGRSEFCRKHGFEYRDMEREDGLCIIVAEASCRYKAPARYDDQVIVKTGLRAVRRRVLIFGYEIYRQPDKILLAEGETTHVVVNREGRPCALPDKYRELFETGIKLRNG
ncbi:MAG: acyl-CoA thioesterase [Acidobacteria bacterium]|nr:MAG: acyl-CoA thioesterase [Acidobacteriota bacterium]